MKETRQIPVQKGKTYELSIQGLGTSGEGIGRYEASRSSYLTHFPVKRCGPG